MVATASNYADNDLAGLFLRQCIRICRKPAFAASQTKDGIGPDFICSESYEQAAPFRMPQFATARPLRGRFLNGGNFPEGGQSGRAAFGVAYRLWLSMFSQYRCSLKRS